MLPERSWENLLEWREEMLLAGQPLAMSRIISEQRVTIEKEEGDVADKGEIGEKESEEMEASLADGERGEEDEKTEASCITQQTIVNAIKSGKPQPQIKSNVKTKIDFKNILSNKQHISTTNAIEDINKNENIKSVEARLESQECKVSELIKTVEKMCLASATMMEQFTKIIQEVKKELAQSKKERQSLKSIEELKQLIRDDYTKQFDEVKRTVNRMEDAVELLLQAKQEFLNYEEPEVSGKDDNTEGEVWPTEETNLNVRISNIVKECCKDFMRSEKNKANESGINSISKDIKETLKLEIVNKSMGVKRDYKLTSDMKFEHFYDFFSSELRSFDLLYVIDGKIRCDIVDEKILNEQKFKVRDILINRLENHYHSKVMHLYNPVEILNKLKEIKRCENNVTSFDIKKQLYNMKYIIGKEKAGEFSERFEDVVRSYENSPNAIPLSDDEKRSLFYNAVKVSVPTLQTIEFVTQSTKGNGPTYENLKMLVMQDEAARNQASGGEKSEIRAANLAQSAGPRCYECQSYGHMAGNCPNIGKGPLCYKCRKFGHKAPECTSQVEPMSSTSRGRCRGSVKYNQNNNHNRGAFRSGFTRRGLKRKMESRHTHFSKRSRFRGAKGASGYKNNSNKGNSEKVDEKKKNTSQSSDQQNRNKGEYIVQNLVEKCKNNFIVECNLLNTEDVYTTTGKSDLGRCVTKFLADSGATEHLTKSRLIFKTFDELKCGEIRCANKNNSANLKTEGVGKIEISLENGKSLEIDSYFRECTQRKSIIVA